MLDAGTPVEPVVVPVVIISRFSGNRGTRRGLTVVHFVSLDVQVVVRSVVIGGDAGLYNLERPDAIERGSVVGSPHDDLDIGDQARRQGLFQLVGSDDPEFRQLGFRHA